MEQGLNDLFFVKLRVCCDELPIFMPDQKFVSCKLSALKRQKFGDLLLPNFEHTLDGLLCRQLVFTGKLPVLIRTVLPRKKLRKKTERT